MKLNSTLEAHCVISPKNYLAGFLRIGLVYLSALFIFLATGKVSAQSPIVYPSLTFNSPTLISGTDLQVNAVYKFPNVVAGVDAHVTIMGISGGAWLSEIDNTTGAGYYDAFQPYVGAGANDTSYMDWKFVFKKAGTNTDTILPVLAVTGVDVDGDNSALKEFIQAATPGSFALAPDTYLNFSFDGVRSTAVSTTNNYPLIDTANRRSMFQMNFTNINTILYRNGSITTGGTQVRQTCIYFKSFFDVMTILPVKIISFNARPSGKETIINWSATSEEDLRYYAVQKSTDGNKWTDIARVSPGMPGATNNYSVTDYDKNTGTVFYRLQQTGVSGAPTYSKTVRVAWTEAATQISNTSAINNTISLLVNSKSNTDYVFTVYTITGVKIKETQNKFYTGVNRYSFDLPHASGKGIYVLVVKDKSGQLIYNAKISAI